MVRQKKQPPPFLQKIFDRIEALGKSRSGVLKACGLANSTFNDWIDGSTPSFEKLDRVLAEIHWDRSNLDGDTSKDGIKLIASFEILGGDMFAPARGKPKEFSLSLLSEESLVSLEVATDEYKPRYRLGDVVAGPRQERNFHNLVGVDCIAESKDGKMYFKKLGKRDAKGRYTLKSFDEDTDEIAGVEIKWLAPIKFIYRP